VGLTLVSAELDSDAGTAEADSSSEHPKGHFLNTDPAHPITLNQTKVLIPDIIPKLEELNKKLAWEEDPLNDSDDEFLKDPAPTPAPPASAVKPLKSKRSLVDSSSPASVVDLVKGRVIRGTPAKDRVPFTPVGPDILKLVRMLQPPKAPNRGALLSVTKEIKAMMAEQEKEGPVKCGFYFDPERSNDNVFAWLVEIPIASFEQSIPLIADCKAKGVTR